MEGDIMNISIGDKHLEEKIEELLESIPKEIVKEFINAYYSLRSQQCINDKKYSELERLEGLVDLYALLNNAG